jgi:hypothetical protein
MNDGLSLYPQAGAVSCAATTNRPSVADKENGPNAVYALRPSYFWMPQVGYGIRTEAIIFREPALFNFAHCPNFKWQCENWATYRFRGGYAADKSA